MGDGDLAFARLVASLVVDNLGQAIDVALIQYGLFRFSGHQRRLGGGNRLSSSL
jgi:hypothetical protein